MLGRTIIGKGMLCADGATQFTDVPENSTHERYITCLKNHHLISGYPDGTFGPDLPVKRGEAAKMISGFLALTESNSQTLANGQAIQDIQNAAACQSVSVGEQLTLSTPGYNQDQDCLTLPVIAIGSSYLIALSDQGWNSHINIEIRDIAGNVMATRETSSREGAASLVWAPTKAGSYVVYLTNLNRFAKEASEYRLRIDQITGSRIYRVDPSSAGVCGEDNHIQLEIYPVNADDIKVEVRKCDFTNFNEGGVFWIRVDGEVRWGPFSYSSGISSFRQIVQPASINIGGRHRYQLLVHPSGNANRAMTTGEVRVWDFYSERNIDFRDIDYIYHIASPDTNCKGILELRLRPENYTIEARVRKCDRTSFNSSGKLWILADGTKRWGPFPFEAGDSSIYVNLDPKGGYDILWYERYEAWIYSNCDHGAPGCNPNESIQGGSVRSAPYLQTLVTARRDGAIWPDIGIWRTSPSGSPAATGEFKDYLPDGTGDWDYYLSKATGYTIDESIYDADVSFRETDTHYKVKIVPGRKVKLDYIQDCLRLVRRSESLEGGMIDLLTPPNCGEGLYQVGTTVNFTAVPTNDYSFSHWEGSLSGSSPSASTLMDDDKTIVAHFDAPCYSIELSALPTNGGSIQVAPAPNCAENRYVVGTQVTIQAVPNTGFEFAGWLGIAAGIQNPEIVPVSAGTVIAAQFTALLPTSTPAPTTTPTVAPQPPSATPTPTTTPTVAPQPPSAPMLFFAEGQTSGAPGSYFMLHGVNFPPNSAITLMVNGIPLPTFTSDAQGGFVLIILTTPQTTPRTYEFTAAQVGGASASMTVTQDGAYRDATGLSGVALPVAAIYLPVIQK